MELLFLFCLYYLSQRPDFADTMKPILGSLKNSEDMLKFMNDLSRFSELFSLFSAQADKGKAPPPPPKNDEQGAPASDKPPQSDKTSEKKDEKNPSSATEGIADEFIERCLQNYFKNR